MHEYQVMAASFEATIPLQNGVSFTATTERHMWEYYSIPVTSTGYDLHIVCTTITGDPDLYVSTQVTHPNASESWHEWHSNQWLDDSIFIENAEVATYYIGVYGYTNSTYTMVASISSHVPDSINDLVHLVDGQPQTGVVEENQLRYYSFEIAAGVQHESVTFTVTKVFGDPDIYISRSPSTPPPPRRQHQRELADLPDHGCPSVHLHFPHTRSSTRARMQAVIMLLSIHTAPPHHTKQARRGQPSHHTSHIIPHSSFIIHVKFHAHITDGSCVSEPPAANHIILNARAHTHTHTHTHTTHSRMIGCPVRRMWIL